MGRSNREEQGTEACSNGVAEEEEEEEEEEEGV